MCFVQARLDPEQVGDEMLPTVGWSWLTEALDQNGAAHVALGGTVTQTSSVRFGDIAGPRRNDDIELRASWTPAAPEGSDGDLRCHAEAFCTLIVDGGGPAPRRDRRAGSTGSGELAAVAVACLRRAGT